MTILPKKKQNKNSSTNDDEREKECVPDRYGFSHSSNNPNTGQLSPNSRNWSSRTDDKRSAPDNAHSLGPTHSKRRHRGVRGLDRDGELRNSLLNCSSIRPKNKSSHSNTNRSSPDHDHLAIPGCSSMVRNVKEELLSSNDFSNDPNCEEDFSGYNSGDEYQKPNENLSTDQWEEKESLFELILQKKGFHIKKMSEDGACLFRAVADQVYGDQEMHTTVRKLCMDYMEKNGDYFSQYVTENFSDYIQRKRCDHIHGNHIEIQALSEIYNRPIQVYHYSAEPINIENCQKYSNEPIRLSYHRNSHYNSIIDPHKPSIGVGLGFPSFKTGHQIEEKSLETALRISEQQEIDQALLDDEIRETDWEATNDAIEEQIARESYIEWLRENERRHTQSKSRPTSTYTEVDSENDNNATINQSLRCYSPRSTSNSNHSSKDRKSPKRLIDSINLIDSKQNDRKSNESPVSLMTDLERTSSFLHEVPASILGEAN
ncbi:60S ribosomal protein l17 [Sarcoptes scabiei]|nr:60S ribosomal protein l17 [Sarcoptes scabiei]